MIPIERGGQTQGVEGKESGELVTVMYANIDPFSRFAGGQSAQGCKIPHDT